MGIWWNLGYYKEHHCLQTTLIIFGQLLWKIGPFFTPGHTACNGQLNEICVTILTSGTIDFVRTNSRFKIRIFNLKKREVWNDPIKKKMKWGVWILKHQGSVHNLYWLFLCQFLRLTLYKTVAFVSYLTIVATSLDRNSLGGQHNVPKSCCNLCIWNLQTSLIFLLHEPMS